MFSIPGVKTSGCRLVSSRMVFVREHWLSVLDGRLMEVVTNGCLNTFSSSVHLHMGCVFWENPLALLKHYARGSKTFQSQGRCVICSQVTKSSEGSST